MTRVPESEWEWTGKPGHLIVSHDCRFHLNTRVGNYIVSTVGEYFPDAGTREILAESRGVRLKGRGDERRADYMEKVGYEEIGCGRKYETMVFRWDGKRCECGCQMPVASDLSEIDFCGYNDPAEASIGHMTLCRKYAEAQ